MTLLDFIENLANNNNNNNNNNDVNKQLTDNLNNDGSCKCKKEDCNEKENSDEEDNCFQIEDPELLLFAEDLGIVALFI